MRGEQIGSTGSSCLSRLRTEVRADRGDRVLVVEDSKSIRALLCAYLSGLDGMTVVEAASLAEVRRLLDVEGQGYTCAVCDLNLPDAPDGQVVDLVRSRDIPVVVLTGLVDDALREQMLKKQVVDYVIKRNTTEIEHVADVVGCLCGNRAVKVLVVDDSPSFRLYLEELLKQYRYQTFTAEDGRQALEQVRRHPDISLVITDYNMPNMDGQELIQTLRRDYRREDMAIIGLSDRGRKGLSARLLKTGANDFLNKPFEVEEFYCRVTQNTNMISYVRQVRDSATRDFLTRVYNRRHLFDVGETLYANAKRGSICLAAAVIDADHFKRINDTWGHQVGDQALRAIAETLTDSVRKSDVVARYGGEEFVILAVLKAEQDAQQLFERIRANLAAIRMEAVGEPVPITASIGVTLSLEDDLDAMLQRADAAVYQAKEAGRNRVVLG